MNELTKAEDRITRACRRSVPTWPLALAGAIALGAVAADSARGQAQTERTIEQYACKDVMRESGANREVAIAFLHGFLLGRSGSSKFDLDAVKKKTDAFIDYCLDNPGEKAVEAMTRLK